MTGKRITVTQHTVLLALAEMHARFMTLPQAARLEQGALNEGATPGEYAAATAPYIFSLLERHAERS